MSELIDRIFDVEKISGEINTILLNLNSLNTALSGVKDNVNAISGSTRKSKGVDDLTAQSQKLNDEFSKGQKVMKTWQDEVSALNAKTEQLTGAEKAASIEIAKARLELQAAQKATKEAAIAEIEKTASTKDLTGSYKALELQLKVASREYKLMTDAERNSAQGKELLKKIADTNVSLKSIDAGMGNYQRNVGNYELALGKLPGVFGTIQTTATSSFNELKSKIDSVKNTTLEMKEAFNKSSEAVKIAANAAKAAELAELALKEAEMAGAATSELAATAEIARATATTAATTATTLGTGAMKLFKIALISTGIGALVVALGAVVAYFTQTNEGSKQFAKISAGINAVIQSGVKILGSYGKLLFAIATFDLKKIKEGWSEIGTNIKNATGEIQENYKAGVQNTQNQQMMAKREREWSLQKLKLQKEFEDAKIMAGKRSALDDEGKEKAAKRALKINEQIFQNDLKIAQNKAKMVEDEQKLVSKKDYQAIQDAKNKVQEIINEHSRQQLTVGNLLGKTEQRIEAGNKSEVLSGAEKDKAIIASRRKLIDMQISLMVDSEEKELKLNSEKYSRMIEDLQKSGELTNQLKLDIEKASQNEQDKIKSEWDKKRKEGEEKTAKELLDIELKRIESIQKGIEKQTEILSKEYQNQELKLKKQLSKGLITQQQYEDELSKLKLDALLDVNRKQIKALQDLLTDSKLTDDKRAELSAKLAQLQIDNENAVVDATIKANDDKVKADEDAKAKRIAVAEALANATQEIFGAIADYAIQQSEQRIAELEKEQETSDKTFEKEQGNLDNALMSDETRAQKQTELNEKKAASDKVIADKIQAEKIKQAKWEKANAIVQAVIAAQLAVLKASQTTPFIPLGLIAAGLATTMGAIQIATIASQPIPAYEKGGITDAGLALWGEKRAEVAVTPSGQTFIADKPTISNFDAGTKIYKSVSDYENFIAKQSLKEVVFDYDKFGEKMPQNNIILDGSGLWSIVNKQNARRTIINRRYSNR